MKKWFPMADIMVLRRHILWNNYGGQQMRRSYSDRAAGHIGGESDLGLSPLLFPHYFRIIFLLFLYQCPTIAIYSRTIQNQIIYPGNSQGSMGGLKKAPATLYGKMVLQPTIHGGFNQSDDDSQMIWGCLNMWCAPKQRFYGRNDE